MQGKKRSVASRIFFSNTCMVLVTLLIFLLVNVGIIKVCADVLKVNIITSSELQANTFSAQNLLESWSPSASEQAYASLAGELEKNGFRLCIQSGKHTIFSNISERSWTESDDLSDYLVADDAVHIFVISNTTILSRYDAAQDMELYAIAGEHSETYWLHEKGFLLFVLLFLVDGLLCIGALLLMSQLFTRNLTRHILAPLEELRNGAARMKRGILTQPVFYHGDVEFEQVCDTFNEMQQALLQERGKNKKYETARTEMIAGISHDLRTPLTAIRGTIKGLQDGIADTPEKQKKFLDIAYRRTLDMNVLLQKLFYFSKLETGNMPLELEKADMTEFLSAYSNTAQEVYAEQNVRIHCSLSHVPCYVSIDRSQMKRILDNLLENSRKYAQADALTISISLSSDALNHTITFSDNGCGVPAEKLPHIFEQFYRGDESRNQSDGNGLGLYIVKYLTEAMGGTVSARNESGLAVCIQLPHCKENP